MRRTLVVACFLLLSWASLAAPAAADPGRGANVLCYVWSHASSPALNTPFVPSTTYSYNAVGRSAANTVTRTAAGTYVVTCKGVGGGALFAGSGTWGAGGHVQVTAYGGNANYCKVVSWGTGGADFSAGVACFNSAGGRSDSQFDLLFVW